jgi:hypothetical protein
MKSFKLVHSENENHSLGGLDSKEDEGASQVGLSFVISLGSTNISLFYIHLFFETVPLSCVSSSSLIAEPLFDNVVYY